MIFKPPTCDSDIFHSIQTNEAELFYLWKLYPDISKSLGYTLKENFKNIRQWRILKCEYLYARKKVETCRRINVTLRVE